MQKSVGFPFKMYQIDSNDLQTWRTQIRVAATVFSYANVLYTMFIDNSVSYSFRNHITKSIRDYSTTVY